jgi:hypothetical protein
MNQMKEWTWLTRIGLQIWHTGVVILVIGGQLGVIGLVVGGAVILVAGLS